MYFVSSVFCYAYYKQDMPNLNIVNIKMFQIRLINLNDTVRPVFCVT